MNNSTTHSFDLKIEGLGFDHSFKEQFMPFLDIIIHCIYLVSKTIGQSLQINKMYLVYKTIA